MKKLANAPQKFCSNCNEILADEDTGYDEVPQEESTSVKCTRVFI